MNIEDVRIILAMAAYDMKISEVARAVFMHRNTVLYHLTKIKAQTGLDARRFYDLVKLLKIAKEVLAREKV